MNNFNGPNKHSYTIQYTQRKMHICSAYTTRETAANYHLCRWLEEFMFKGQINDKQGCKKIYKCKTMGLLNVWFWLVGEGEQWSATLYRNRFWMITYKPLKRVLLWAKRLWINGICLRRSRQPTLFQLIFKDSSV